MFAQLLTAPNACSDLVGAQASLPALARSANRVDLSALRTLCGQGCPRSTHALGSDLAGGSGKMPSLTAGF
jgi:hypothetical protein